MGVLLKLSYTQLSTKQNITLRKPDMKDDSVKLPSITQPRLEKAGSILEHVEGW